MPLFLFFTFQCHFFRCHFSYNHSEWGDGGSGGWGLLVNHPHPQIKKKYLPHFYCHNGCTLDVVWGCFCGVTIARWVTDHQPEFESRRGHIWRVFHLWLRFITFGGRSAHLACGVDKSGHKNTNHHLDVVGSILYNIYPGMWDRIPVIFMSRYVHFYMNWLIDPI